jgi:hypothetical protein
MARQVKEEFKSLLNYDRNMLNAIIDMETSLANFLAMLSRPDVAMYYFTSESKTKKEKYFDSRFYMHLRVQKPEVLNLTLDGISRPAYRVGWASRNGGMEWFSIKGSQLNLSNDFSEIRFDVYIQSHALIKLYERIDCDNWVVPIMSFNFSLKDPVIHQTTPNCYLLELRINDLKAGYIVMEGSVWRVTVKNLFIYNL